MKKIVASAIRFLIIVSAGLFLFIGSSSAYFSDKPAVPTNTEMFEWVKEVVAITDRYPEFRRSGTEGDSAVRTHIMDTLKSFGYSDVEEQTYEFQYRHYDKWQLVVDGKTIPSYFMRGTEFTPENGVEAELVYVGERIEAHDLDLSGKIVVMDLRGSPIPGAIINSPESVDFAYDPQGTLVKGAFGGKGSHHFKGFPASYYQAVGQGAVGMVAILKDYDTGTDRYYPDVSSMVHPRVPGLYLGKYAGEALVEKLKASDTPLRATLNLQGEVRDATTANIVAKLSAGSSNEAGAEKETLLVTTHHDAGWSGAVQDGSGIAAVLGLAKYYAQVSSSDRKKNLLFVFDASHYDWNYPKGSSKFMAMNPELMEQVVLVIGIEHIAKKFIATPDGNVDTGELEPRLLFTPRNRSLFEIAKRAIVDNRLHDIAIPNKKLLEIAGETMGYYKRGIPTFAYISGPEYLFLSDDILDKVAWEQFEPVVNTFIQIIDSAMNMHGTSISRIDR